MLSILLIVSLIESHTPHVGNSSPFGPCGTLKLSSQGYEKDVRIYTCQSRFWDDSPHVAVETIEIGESGLRWAICIKHTLYCKDVVQRCVNCFINALIEIHIEMAAL